MEFFVAQEPSFTDKEKVFFATKFKTFDYTADFETAIAEMKFSSGVQTKFDYVLSKGEFAALTLVINVLKSYVELDEANFIMSDFDDTKLIELIEEKDLWKKTEKNIGLDLIKGWV
jgi:hypothetical protein